MARTNQSGSVLGFILIGCAMAILLVGGAYFARRAMMPKDDQTASQRDNSEPQELPGGNDTDTADNAPAQSTDDDKDTQQPTQTQDDTVATTDTLPQTGPADMLVGAVMLGAMVTAGTAYVRSRNTIASL